MADVEMLIVIVQKLNFIQIAVRLKYSLEMFNIFPPFCIGIVHQHASKLRQWKTIFKYFQYQNIFHESMIERMQQFKDGLVWCD